MEQKSISGKHGTVHYWATGQGEPCILFTHGATMDHALFQSQIEYFAKYFTHRVSSLIAVDSSPVQPSYYSKLDMWFLAITPSLLRFYPYGSLIKTIAKQIAIQESSQAYALETLRRYSKSEIAQIMDAVYRGVKAYGHNDILPVPLLIIFGEADRTGKVQSYCKQWAEKEKRPLQIISGAAHNANMDNPQEFNRIVDDFLREAEAISSRS